MDSDRQITRPSSRRVILSTLWIFAVFNYLYADLISITVSPALRDMATRMTAGVLLGWAVFMETAIAMVLLSRVLPYGANRGANLIAGVAHTATVAWIVFGGKPQPYYIFFAATEMACTVFIVWYAWSWRPEAAQRSTAPSTNAGRAEALSE